ncbi:MAG TPA: DUF6690 family protein [Pirellulales bacterium]|nr:DUF6690 family protein [Pirellulales bacterium]
MFFNRHFLLVTLLAGAVVVPYVANSEQVQKLWSSVAGSQAEGEAAEKLADANAGPGGVPQAAVPGENERLWSHDNGMPPPPTQVEGASTPTLEEVLRFDVTPTWISQRWPRVSTGLSELDLQGYRVALVTGTGDSDLAGSLTYYFDKKKQTERIIFHGTSGDPSRLVALCTKRYELKQQKTEDPSLTLFRRTWFGNTKSELRIRPAGVMRSDVPQARYEIELALRRP